MDFIEVCTLHSHLFSSCDCDCTCDHGMIFTEDRRSVKARIRATHHDMHCRVFDPRRQEKAGNRRFLVRSPGPGS